MNVYLDLPPYLSQWLANRCGGSSPIRLPRGSIELTILHTSLRAPRAGERPQVLCPKGWTAVEVPAFKGFPLDSRNFLPDSARRAIEDAVRQRFDRDLWPLALDADYRLVPLHRLIELWMETHGIEPDDTNTQAVTKRLRRLRVRALGMMRQRRLRARKNTPENMDKTTPETNA